MLAVHGRSFRPYIYYNTVVSSISENTLLSYITRIILHARTLYVKHLRRVHLIIETDDLDLPSLNAILFMK